jgi:sensor histidine kinase regulating citrate/malate metabolism
MLNDMRQTAKLRGTHIEYDIKYDMKDVMCNAFECNKVIGNLIQNALDAIHSEAEKEYGIRVGIYKRCGYTAITVSNYFEGNTEGILHAFDLEYSTKEGHEGIGLTMIEKTLSKYSGRVYAEVDDKVVNFIANIPNRITYDE